MQRQQQQQQQKQQHKENLRGNLQKRLQVAKDEGNFELIELLERESAYLDLT